jgi:hypothetical protein
MRRMDPFEKWAGNFYINIERERKRWRRCVSNVDGSFVSAGPA